MTKFMRTSFNVRAATCAAALLGLLAAQSPAQIVGSLTSADIQAAIEAGMQGRVAPFSMYPTGGDLGKKALAAGSRAPALVYTPFVRVALHAQSARDRRESMTPANVPRDAIDPIVYIGFTWRVCCGEVEERFKDGTLAIHAVFDPSATRNPAAMGRALRQPKAQPLWIRAGTEPLRELGIEPPPHIEAVAAFPVDVVLAAVGFRIARTSTGEPPSTAAVLVAAVPDDLARWR